MNIDLSTGTAPSPERTLHLAGVMAEIARVLNHATLDHGALGSPADAHRVIGELAAAAQRLPQLVDQVSRWVGDEHAWGCVTVRDGRPGAAVAAMRAEAGRVRAAAAALEAALKGMARVTAGMSGPEEDRAE